MAITATDVEKIKTALRAAQTEFTKTDMSTNYFMFRRHNQALLAQNKILIAALSHDSNLDNLTVENAKDYLDVLRKAMKALRKGFGVKSLTGTLESIVAKQLAGQFGPETNGSEFAAMIKAIRTGAPIGSRDNEFEPSIDSNALTTDPLHDLRPDTTVPPPTAG
jgi:hypothetical protein